jgi:hypothetical protein
MAGRRLTTTDLIAEVRSLLDEQNTEQIRDVEDVLPALNRAQDAAANILARHYQDPLLTYTSLVTIADQAEYDIPEDAFEQRVEKIELRLAQGANGTYAPIERISFRDIADFDAPLNANVPYYYATIGRQIRLVPTPTGALTLRVWYMRDPEPLVLPQGRITIVNEPGNYIVLDEVGSDLTTAVDQLNSYISISDGETGKVKGRFQIQSIVGAKVALRSVPLRTSVLEKEISSSLADLQIKPDDLVSTIHGVPLPFMKKPLTNFLISYATADIRVNKLGGEQGLLPAQIQMFQEQVERSWVGRENTLRVKRSNRNLTSQLRRNSRYLYNSGD